MTYLLRSRKSFTLLELMVAFIIMAVLSAVAIPSLIGVVGNDQVTADSTSAISIVDAAYFNAESQVGEASPTLTFPITAAEAAEFIPAGSTLTAGDLTDFLFGDPTHSILFTFPDGNTVYVSAPQSAGAPSPSVLGVNDGGEPGGATTTTTVVEDSEPTCAVVATGPYGAYQYPLIYSVNCTGVTGEEVEVTVPVGNGGFVFFRILSADAWLNGGNTALPSSFTVDQSYANPSDDSTPGAPYVLYAIYYPNGMTLDSSITVPGIGQTLTSGLTSSCEATGSGCGTPTATLTDFSTEPDCSIAATGPFVAYTVPSAWSVSCTGVAGSTVQIWEPVPGGQILFELVAADVWYGTGSAPFAALPSSFSIDQTYANPSDDSVPSAVGAQVTFYPTGTSPNFGVGQSFPDGGYDTCVTYGTYCGTPTITLSGF